MDGSRHVPTSRLERHADAFRARHTSPMCRLLSESLAKQEGQRIIANDWSTQLLFWRQFKMQRKTAVRGSLHELFCVYARDTDMLHSPKKGLASAATGASGYTCPGSMGAIGALRKKFCPRIPAWGWFSGLPTTVTLVSQESAPSPTTMKPARPSHSRRLMNLTVRRR